MAWIRTGNAASTWQPPFERTGGCRGVQSSQWSSGPSRLPPCRHFLPTRLESKQRKGTKPAMLLLCRSPWSTRKREPHSNRKKKDRKSPDEGGGSVRGRRIFVLLSSGTVTGMRNDEAKNVKLLRPNRMNTDRHKEAPTQLECIKGRGGRGDRIGQHNAQQAQHSNTTSRKAKKGKREKENSEKAQTRSKP